MPPVQMVIGVVPDVVIVLENQIECLRVFLEVLSHAEKRRFDVVFFQDFQDLRGEFRNRAIVEGQVYFFLVSGKIPSDAVLGDQSGDRWWLNEFIHAMILKKV